MTKPQMGVADIPLIVIINYRWSIDNEHSFRTSFTGISCLRPEEFIVSSSNLTGMDL